MLVTVYQLHWMTEVPLDTIRADPTRMAQGIMTGIGFLGAGVIFKEGLTVRGLTTAASIWITAAIGILIGIGFYFSGHPWRGYYARGSCDFPSHRKQAAQSEFYANHVLRFERGHVMSENELEEASRRLRLFYRKSVVPLDRRRQVL